MNDYSATGNYFTIGHLVQFTGLTDRTIRNYIASGVLQGEKINGIWHFTPEQTNSFLTNSAVRCSILAVRNAVVNDFLLDDRKATHQTCMILDLPGGNMANVSEYFCSRICEGDFHDLRFNLDCHSKGTIRVILKGQTEEILSLVTDYYKR